MIHAHQVQNAVQHEDSNFGFRGVPEPERLGARAAGGNRNVPQARRRRPAAAGETTTRRWIRPSRGIRGSAGEAPHPRHQAIERPALAHFLRKPSRKPPQSGRAHSRWNAPERHRTAFGRTWRGAQACGPGSGAASGSASFSVSCRPDANRSLYRS